MRIVGSREDMIWSPAVQNEAGGHSLATLPGVLRPP